jgi:hypothetical protein
MRESIQSHLDTFRTEIAEYERLVKCDRVFDLKIEVDSILELPRVLIKARIAAKIIQKNLQIGWGWKKVELSNTKIQIISVQVG